MRIVVLALGVPYPPLGGGLTRTYHLLRALASQHDVTLAAFTYGDTHDPPPYPLELHAVPWAWSRDYEAMTLGAAAASQRAYERLAFETAEPWFAGVMDPSAMDAALASIFRQPCDLVLLEGSPMARFLPVIPIGIPKVLDLLDIHTVMAERALRRADSVERALEFDYQRTLAFERDAAQACDACLSVSHADAGVARTLLEARAVHVVPNGVDTAYFTPASGATDPGMLLFTGRMSYAPNVDAVRHFVDDILPRIRHDAPSAVLHVVGAAPTGEVIALRQESVVVHGRVDDVRPFQHRAEVVVAPIRSGGGTRLKVLEAAACGKAIVVTPLGVEGLPLRHGMEVVIADSSADFAAAVVALLRDPARRRELGGNARAATPEFDWAAIGESCRAILEQVVTDRA